MTSSRWERGGGGGESFDISSPFSTHLHHKLFFLLLKSRGAWVYFFEIIKSHAQLDNVYGHELVQEITLEEQLQITDKNSS